MTKADQGATGKALMLSWPQPDIAQLHQQIVLFADQVSQGVSR